MNLIAPDEATAPGLARTLKLTHAVLYGLGVTIGAGIYVLVGPAIGRAGWNAPAAFALAAVLMAFTAASFAELGARLPVAAGEAAFVEAGFRSGRLGDGHGIAGGGDRNRIGGGDQRRQCGIHRCAAAAAGAGDHCRRRRRDGGGGVVGDQGIGDVCRRHDGNRGRRARSARHRRSRARQRGRTGGELAGRHVAVRLGGCGYDVGSAAGGIRVHRLRGHRQRRRGTRATAPRSAARDPDHAGGDDGALRRGGGRRAQGGKPRGADGEQGAARPGVRARHAACRRSP